MFEIATGRDVIIRDVQQGNIPLISHQHENNGITKYIKPLKDRTLFNHQTTISLADRGVFYATNQNEDFHIGTRVKALSFKQGKINKKVRLFLVSAINKLQVLFTEYSQNATDKLPFLNIALPTKDGYIDYAFMETFIAELEAQRLAELEAQRLAELEAYLAVTGLQDYTLTQEEEEALSDFDKRKIEWREYRFADIFNNIQQGRRLKKDDQIEGNIPFVMAGITNTGVVNYISNPVATFPKNAITIDIFGNAFYRNYDFGAGDDTGVYWNTERELSREMMLFLTKASEKALEGKFSYGKKLRSSQSLNFRMKLPTKNGTPDYDFMNTYISAIHKLVIKEVVFYADRKIEATKKVIKK